ncbi:MAG: class I SAM-dependent methyltransferase [Candidatus Binatia bacterium]
MFNQTETVREPSSRQRLRSEEGPRCRFCDSSLRHVFVDLGMSPLSNAYLKFADLARMEPFYPLVVFVCERCFLVQLEEFESPGNIFSDYAYFSSFSDSWVEHARVYTHMIVERFGMERRHRVVEIASNDGYLLQHFVAKEISVLGIEPAANVAEAAVKKGIPTVVEFFGESLARRLVAEGAGADLIVGNNVLAHVPRLNDFVKGLKILLKPGGVITLEFPHLMRLIEENQFDTIYHEHFSYFSLHAVRQVMAAHGLIIFDVEELSTHGGSLRIYARHQEDQRSSISSRVADLAAREEAAAVANLETYVTFGEKVKHTKRKFLDFLIAAKNEGKSVVGYGAPAKGNTLLNYCGVRTDFIDYTVDRSPHKQGHFLPGTRIPIHHPDRIRETRPDYVLILPWNLTHEISAQMSYIREWNGRFVVPIPEVKVL